MLGGVSFGGAGWGDDRPTAMDTLARRYRTGTHQHSGLTNYQVSCGCVRVPSARRTASTLQNSGTQHSSGVPRRRGGVRRHAPPPHASADSDDLQPTRLGPNVAASIKDVKERLTWSPATVIRNECVALLSNGHVCSDVCPWDMPAVPARSSPCFTVLPVSPPQGS